jgi:chemotaxis protein MotB
MRPRVLRSRVGQDRWLVSYADFVTLLFGVFVVLYAFARSDHKKQAQVSQAIDTAFRTMGVFSNSNQTAGAQDAAQPASAAVNEELLTPTQVKRDLDRIQRDLAQTLAKQVAAHTVSLEMGRDGLVISLREAGFFDSGSATPKAEALPALRTIADRLGKTPYDLRIEGHTDNMPIHNAEFDSNWELSSARSALCRGVCRVSSRGRQRHRGRPRGKPARGSCGAAADEVRPWRFRRATLGTVAESDGWGLSGVSGASGASGARSLTV